MIVCLFIVKPYGASSINLTFILGSLLNQDVLKCVMVSKNTNILHDRRICKLVSSLSCPNSCRRNYMILINTILVKAVSTSIYFKTKLSLLVLFRRCNSIYLYCLDFIHYPFHISLHHSAIYQKLFSSNINSLFLTQNIN